MHLTFPLTSKPHRGVKEELQACFTGKKTEAHKEAEVWLRLRGSQSTQKPGASHQPLEGLTSNLNAEELRKKPPKPLHLILSGLIDFIKKPRVAGHPSCFCTTSRFSEQFYVHYHMLMG